MQPSQRFSPFTFLLVLLFFNTAKSASSYMLQYYLDDETSNTGGFSSIRNLSDPHVAEIAQFAVREHNRLEQAKLEYIEVVEGECQIVDGVNYRLLINANDGDDTGSYRALVFEKAWVKYRSLSYLKRI